MLYYYTIRTCFMVINKLIHTYYVCSSEHSKIYYIIILLTYNNYELTVLVHCRLKTLVEPASPTLVSVGFVNGAPAFEFPLCLARVYPVPVDASFEKPGTTCERAFVRDVQFVEQKRHAESYRHNCKYRNVFLNSYPHKLCTGCPINGLL